MRIKVKKIVMFVFAFVMIITPILLGARFMDLWGGRVDASINDLRRRLTSQQERITSNANQRRDLERQIINARGQQHQQAGLERMYDNLIALNAEAIADEEHLLELLDEYMMQTALRIEEKQEAYDRNFELFLQLLQFTYERGTASHLELFLQADNLSSLLTQIDRMAEIANYKRDVLRDLQNDRIDIQQSRDTFERSRADVEQHKEELTARRQLLQGERESVVRAIAELDRQINYWTNRQREADQLEAELENEIRRLTAEIAAANRQHAYVGGSMLWPLPPQHRTVTSPFGYRIHPITNRREFHRGIDIRAPRNTNIYAANDGTVIIAAFNNARGNFVVVEHGGGITTLYSHNTTNLVSVGDTVRRGDVIARVGTTGMSTGYHLHFEVSRNGTALNPLDGWVSRPGG